jgi:tagatose-1,6-bisphosphate aldolase non-catalytic subunit AgaZ/GatZ
MAFTGQLLAEGQLPSSKGTLYTVPGATTAYVRTIRVHNTNAAGQTVLIYVKRGTSRIFSRAVLAQNETLVVDDPVSLEAGDLIEGQTTTATAVDYVITGAEEI